MPRGRPRQFDPETALDAALDLFWRHGYEGTSLAALSAATGLNPPSLYAAFGNKQALFEKVVDRYLAHPASYLARACQQPTARLVAEHLFAGAIDMVMTPNHPDGCLLVQSALATGPDAAPAREQLTRLRHAAESIVRKRLQRAQAEHDLPKNADPTLLARYLMTLIWGLSVQAAGGATRPHLQQVASLALQSLPF